MSKNRTPIFSARARADYSASDRARRSATADVAIDDCRWRGDERRRAGAIDTPRSTISQSPTESGEGSIGGRARVGGGAEKCRGRLVVHDRVRAAAEPL